MSKTAMIHVRIEPEIKKKVDHIMNKLGVSSSEVISMLYHQILLTKGIPFELRIPNKTTRAVFEQTDKGNGLVRSDSLDEMFHKLDL